MNTTDARVATDRRGSFQHFGHIADWIFPRSHNEARLLVWTVVIHGVTYGWASAIPPGVSDEDAVHAEYLRFAHIVDDVQA